MEFLHFLHLVVIIAQIRKDCYSLPATISNDKNKTLEDYVKEALMKIENLEKEIQVLHQKTNINFEHCELQPDDICGPCLCRDDERLLKKYFCDCQNLQAKRDCLEHKQVGRKINGIYKIHQNMLKIIQVYCDQTTDGGGWTVFQRRTDGTVAFFRDWDHYKQGFGNLQNEHWLGNENIFTLTLQGLHPRGNELIIDMMNNAKIKKSVRYEDFHIANAATKYILHVNGYNGTLINAFERHNLLKFSTFDSDNDSYSENCALKYFGGWWFHDCFDTHLNGKYYSAGKMSIDSYKNDILSNSGIHWLKSAGFNGGSDSLIFTEMKVRRKL